MATATKTIPLTREIPLAGSGGVVFPADINNDGKFEFLVLQSAGLFHAAIHGGKGNVGWDHFCLTAMDSHGNVLWRVGEPWDRTEPFVTHGGERSLCVFDLDGDGVPEVYVIRGNEVIVDFLFSDNAGKNWASTKLESNVEKRADLYVFTDPTCGYCQKVEQEAETYRMNGIQVHKIPFPRAGLNIESPGYQKWLAASCSENPAKAYGEMIMGTDAGKYPVPTDLTLECAKIVTEGYNFGLEVGVQGTPFIYGKTVGGDSVMFNGYNPVADVAAKLGILVKPGLSL